MSMIHLTNLCSQLQNASKCRLGLTAVPRNNLTLSIMLLLQREGFISALQHGSVYGPEPIEQNMVTGRIASAEEFDHATDRDRAFNDMVGAPQLSDGVEVPMVRQSGGSMTNTAARQEYWMDRVRRWNPEPPGGVRGQQERNMSSLATTTSTLPEAVRHISPQKSSAEASRPSFDSQTTIMATLPTSKFAEKLGRDSRLASSYTVPGPDTNSSSPSSGAITQATIAQTRLWATLKYHRNMPVLSQMQAISKPTRRIHVKSSDMAQMIRGHTTKLIKGLQPGECMIVGTDRGIMEIREAERRRLGGQLLCRVL